MDYKELLRKYMLYIEEQEGFLFLGRTLDLDNSFNSDEKKMLRDLNEVNIYEFERNRKVKYAPKR